MAKIVLPPATANQEKLFQIKTTPLLVNNQSIRSKTPNSNIANRQGSGNIVTAIKNLDMSRMNNASQVELLQKS
jgi:hypothetical protein